jgi:hypothetical protein
MRTFSLFLLFSLVIIMSCSDPPQRPRSPLEPKLERFAPVELTGDTTALSPGDRQALPKLIAAARIMDELYLRQSWSGSDSLRRVLAGDRSEEGALKLRYFDVNMGPWSRLDHDEPFLTGAPQKPPHANFYPENMTKEEFTAWVAGLQEPERKMATGFFTTIRRGPDGHLTSIPYAVEYREPLMRAATLLRQAAALTDNASLKTYLSLRAEAFLSNDYYASDVAWMDLDSPIDVTIGPYEVYMDELFNYKAAFEAYITLRNDAETAKLAMFSGHLQEVENVLPIDPKYRNPRLGALAPIRVVDEVAVGGEARAGVQTAAFNLPNDERVTTEKGSKRVMLKNVQEAKFERILQPIARLAIDPAQQHLIAFEPFFTFILAHELMHGLGPHSIVVGGRSTTARQEMKDLGSALEEAKADVAGLFMLQTLIDRGILDRATEERMYVTFLAGAFRSVRFGIKEAHGRGMALQFNYLTEKGAITSSEATGTFHVDVPRMKEAVRVLTGEIMTLQARGDYAGAKALLERYAGISEPMRRMLDRLAPIPVDIVPRFPLAERE